MQVSHSDPQKQMHVSLQPHRRGESIWYQRVSFGTKFQTVRVKNRFRQKMIPHLTSLPKRTRGHHVS